MQIPLNDCLKSEGFVYTKLVFNNIFINQETSAVVKKECNFVVGTMHEIAADFPEVFSYLSGVIQEQPVR